MSENKICPICGGYIGVVYLSSSSNPTIRFCPGHHMKAQIGGVIEDGRSPIMCTGVGPELYTLPAGASVFPNNYLQQQETLWEIVQTVANGNPLHEYAGRYYCNYCDERQSSLDLDQIISSMSIEEDYDNGMATFIRQFPHTSDCIVTKARKLLKTRIKVAAVTVKMDGGGHCNAPLPKDGE